MGDTEMPKRGAIYSSILSHTLKLAQNEMHKSVLKTDALCIS